ncbi:MAG: carboxypeptidase-like regulatory domain-containing protein, partial [Candidatus Omnitrophota bacterium]
MRKRTILVVVLFVIFLIIISASIFLIWPQSDTTPHTIIYGKVKDATSDKPIANAQVTVLGTSGVTVQSSTYGDWKLIVKSGGTFKIKITKPGFTEVYRKITLNKGSEDTVSTAFLTPQEPRSSSVVEFEQQGSKKVEMVVFSNGGGSIQLRIPKTVLGQVKVNGVLKDISKEVQITRLSGSLALPGELSQTPNLKFPIAFLFCAEIGPTGAEFIQPVTLRVKNTWGFLPGTEIPVAFWDTKNLEWVGLEKQAVVDAKGEWIQAAIKHLSSYDINSPQSFGRGIPIVDVGPFPDDYTCDIGSGVNVSTGSLMNSVS